MAGNRSACPRAAASRRKNTHRSQKGIWSARSVTGYQRYISTLYYQRYQGVPSKASPLIAPAPPPVAVSRRRRRGSCLPQLPFPPVCPYVDSWGTRAVSRTLSLRRECRLTCNDTATLRCQAGKNAETEPQFGAGKPSLALLRAEFEFIRLRRIVVALQRTPQRDAPLSAHVVLSACQRRPAHSLCVSESLAFALLAALIMCTAIA